MAETTHSDVLIVGAGMAGMMAAHHLIGAGARVQIVDKGYYPGGRMASKTVNGGLADIGAQFFSARDPLFQSWVDRWQAEDLIFVWSHGWSDGSLGVAPQEGHPRYAVHGGMRALALRLADGLNVRTDTTLSRITLKGERWEAIDEQGGRYSAGAVLLTPPVPQSLRLIDLDEVPLTDEDLDTLDSITYDPCLTGVFWMSGRIRLPEPGAVQRSDGPIIWIADNRRKGISPDQTLITVHAGPSASHQLWPMPDWEITVALEAGLRPFKDVNSEVGGAVLHRWRYATPAVNQTERYLQAAGLPGLFFAGDAFGGPRIEGAALSGLAAAQAIAGNR